MNVAVASFGLSTSVTPEARSAALYQLEKVRIAYDKRAATHLTLAASFVQDDAGRNE